MKYSEYELDLFEVEGYHKQTISAHRFWYQHIKKNALKKDGDIFEFGVFRGKSLITAALLLKELKSKKKFMDSINLRDFQPHQNLMSLKILIIKNVLIKKFIKKLKIL